MLSKARSTGRRRAGLTKTEAHLVRCRVALGRRRCSVLSVFGARFAINPQLVTHILVGSGASDAVTGLGGQIRFGVGRPTIYRPGRIGVGRPVLTRPGPYKVFP